VTSIGGQAFEQCSGLLSATFMGNAPSMGASVFNATAKGFTVYYTGGSTGFTSPTWKGYRAVNADIGVFNGLVGDGQIGTGTEAGNMAAFFARNGFLTLTTRAGGSFTGSLRLEGKSLAVKGEFDGAGVAGVTVLRPGKSSVLVNLQLDSTAAGRVTGTVTTGGAPMAFELLASRPMIGKRYTVILPSPDDSLGHGYATLVIAAKGTATLAGKLADGTTYTTTSPVVDGGDGNWLVPVHIPLYTGSAGMIFGEVLLPKTGPADSADVTGSLGWLRPANTRAKMFPAGFLKSLDPLGESYQLIKNISLLTGTSATGNFTLTADPLATLLPAALTQAGAWPANNVPLLPKPATAAMKLTFTATTGLFKGSFSRTINGKPLSTPYEGAVLANPLTLPGGLAPVRAAGFFSTGTASGPVELTAP